MIHFILVASPLVLVLAFFGTALIRTNLFSQWKRRSNRRRERLLALFSSYLIWLLFFLLISNSILGGLGVKLGVDTHLKDSGVWGLNLVPFRTILTYHKHVSGFNYLSNIWGNILLIVPLGLMAPLLWKAYSKFWPLFFQGLVFLLLVETIQYKTGRSGDIDDIILNLIGLSLGYLLSKALTRVFPKKIYQR